MLGDPEKIDGENRWESNESITSQVVNISREIGANVENKINQRRIAYHRDLKEANLSLIACQGGLEK